MLKKMIRPLQILFSVLYSLPFFHLVLYILRNNVSFIREAMHSSLRATEGHIMFIGMFFPIYLAVCCIFMSILYRKIKGFYWIWIGLVLPYLTAVFGNPSGPDTSFIRILLLVLVFILLLAAIPFSIYLAIKGGMAVKKLPTD